MIELLVHPGIGPLVIGLEFPMPDQDQGSFSPLAQLVADTYTAEVIELKELKERWEGLEVRIDHLRQELAGLREQQRWRVEEREVIQSLSPAVFIRIQNVTAFL